MDTKKKPFKKEIKICKKKKKYENSIFVRNRKSNNV